ncbi:NAD-dependent succinate-semialdehyde dehydrogenase [Pseudomonas typographi]|uniref:NAD-dependent succinate-semialdehyde dehydrogenase n=1 Tax=Pseudomonas typographi TaxID=2715964 RepID=A0ABR7YVC1_9PSED|nr:NAD-dependent succinate-semialdehyde dehydrogenase [Pseudomonas typographi]MBD1585107.1 NAD-dependent succinate-semialdehyde dehydrogenase [Pseudomonas typographi]MBD1597154.1 NAD-dependent succinate-semialdehyde dehydrogenase [Pseudomonas typographi]
MNAPAYPPLALFIDGQWLHDGRAGQPVYDPGTGAQLGELPHADDRDLEAALAAAYRAFGSWRLSSPMVRAQTLQRFAVLIGEQAETIARHLTLDQGKPLAEALGEVRFAAEHAQWHAEECRRLYGRVIPARDLRVQQSVVLEPVGVCAAFTPWNFPFSQALRKVCAALGAGCTLILKGPEDTPSAVMAIARLLQEAGLPDGCLNLVWGEPAHISRTLIGDPRVSKVSFTGSVPVGRQIAALAGQHLKRSTLELGGHAPVLVFDDADVEATADALAANKLRNAGQVCVSPSRFFVQCGVYERFLERFVPAIAAARIGHGLDEGVQMGPLCHGRRVEAMQSLVDDARQCGATLACGGERLGRQGHFFAPTVVHDAPAHCRLLHEEPFGPLAVVAPFKRFNDAIEQANALPYGLAAYVFSRDAARTHHAARALGAGMVSVNHFGLALPETPFGGINDSGHGSEGGSETFAGYLNTKFITQLDPLPC